MDKIRILESVRQLYMIQEVHRLQKEIFYKLCWKSSEAQNKQTN